MIDFKKYERLQVDLAVAHASRQGVAKQYAAIADHMRFSGGGSDTDRRDLAALKSRMDTLDAETSALSQLVEACRRYVEGATP